MYAKQNNIDLIIIWNSKADVMRDKKRAKTK